jgi:hypothetical protein
MATVTAMERFRAIAGERGMVLGELLQHALDAFVREQDWRAEARRRLGGVAVGLYTGTL